MQKHSIGKILSSFEGFDSKLLSLEDKKVVHSKTAMRLIRSDKLVFAYLNINLIWKKSELLVKQSNAIQMS